MRNAIGIDIGGTSIRAARVSQAGEILAHQVEPTPPAPEATLALIDALIERVGDAGSAAIGIGVPARVNIASGEIFPGGYVNLAGGPLAPRLKAARGRVLFADNDASMALVGEARAGAGRGFAHIVMLTIGTGIGGAAMLDGRVLRGAKSAGQLGHLVVAIDGAACVCGGRGCLETSSSGTALRRFIADAGLPATTMLPDIFARGDSVGQTILSRWAGPLRAGIQSLVAAFDPDIVIVGGGLGGGAVAALQRLPAETSWFRCKVAAAELGDRAGVIGAALAALERAA